ncbi:hypothetical protein CQW23_00113 [Capsicum baccatum]|uniref:TFIIS central domain-containing protein n=1 Tax=Capsicum baccatum TaxID=33114 RepID=A0A2G2XJT1_CAPBA|nr:hypothetical protein CQW23_00113 [Capsicum baccatum]
MGNRRNTVVAISNDDEDEVPISRLRRASSNGGGEENGNQRKRKKIELEEEEEEEKEKPKVKEEEERGRGKRVKKPKKVDEEEEEAKVEEDRVEKAEAVEEEEQLEDAKPIGEVIKVTGKGKGRRNHYKSFELDGNDYELEDHVLLVPEADQKPYVAIIKEVQEELKWKWNRKMCNNATFVFHVSPPSIKSIVNLDMGTCRVRGSKRPSSEAGVRARRSGPEWSPPPRHLRSRYEPGRPFSRLFRTRGDTTCYESLLRSLSESSNKVYDTEQMRLFKLTEKSLDVTRDDEARSRSGQPPAETPGSCANNASEYFTILSNFKVLTGERQCDKWLEKLLQSIQYFCSPVDNAQNDGTENGGSDAADLTGDTDSAKHVNESLDNSADGDVFRWPNSVVPAVVSLEKAAHEALSSDFQKYNQKMRQLTFNLKNTSLLARRLLKGELDPSQILNMSPNELKIILTEEELASREPEEPELIQMTDARCKRCTEKKVRLVDIIQAGHRDRYSLECVACGNTWFASRDEVASLTIGPNLAESVGPEPLATAKFEDVEKNLTSPRRADEGASDILKKTTEAYMPVLDSQKSFNKTKPEDSATTSNADLTVC